MGFADVELVPERYVKSLAESGGHSELVFVTIQLRVEFLQIAGSEDISEKLTAAGPQTIVVLLFIAGAGGG